jgi:hypothetical protein
VVTGFNWLRIELSQYKTLVNRSVMFQVLTAASVVPSVFWVVGVV